MQTEANLVGPSLMSAQRWQMCPSPEKVTPAQWYEYSPDKKSKKLTGPEIVICRPSRALERLRLGVAGRGDPQSLLVQLGEDHGL